MTPAQGSLSTEVLYPIFVAVAAGLGIVVVAFGAALVIAQRRMAGLQREYGQRLLATQDEERAWVAREVHDDVAQRIAVLRHELDLYKRDATTGPGADPRRLDGLAAEVSDLGVAVRRLAHRLHPATLDQGDLRLALEQLAEDARRAYGMKVFFEVGTVPDLRSSGLALVVYRIGQESLRNIAKHAGTDTAHLGIRLEQGQLVVTIRDDGTGFDLAAPGLNGKARGLGLLSMRERASQVGGTVDIRSAAGRGTTVRITHPLRDRHDR
ncbi:MAG TPA: sensor histidine kinase [Anaeromyxobacteraceae bacterium]|nr:sensor histidine kinase [Anaeromyxobacteraceae bacterium]